MTIAATLLLIFSILLSFESFATFILGGSDDASWAWGTLACGALMGAIALWAMP